MWQATSRHAAGRRRAGGACRWVLGHHWGVSFLVWDADLPELDAPVMVTAFRGWFDVGGAATGAVEWLSERSGSMQVAHIDPEEFFDFTEERPLTRIVDGEREIKWPAIDIHAHRAPSGRDLVMVVGVEPHLRWRAFAEIMADVASRTEASMVVTLGAHISDVPHTRPFAVAGSASDPDLAKTLGLELPSYEGPTGVVGVLHERFEKMSLSAVSLRTGVPHYVTGSPNPKASRALLERFERITGMPTGWAKLDDAAEQWEQKVNEAMLEDDDVVAYVRRLESRADKRAAGAVPSPDDLAAEFERFLKNQANQDDT